MAAADGRVRAEAFGLFLSRPQLSHETLGRPVTSPRFPAITVSPGDSFSVAAAVDALTLTAGSERAIRSGYFDRLYLFDSNGKRWRVVGVERTAASPRGPFGKLVGVSLTFGDPDQPSIDHVAEELCALVDADPDDIYAQFITHDELKTMLRAARSPGELISVAESLGAAAQQADGA